MPDSPLPADHFSTTRRRLVDNPGACRAASTVHTSDFYGNLESWMLETYRVDGADIVLLQRSGADGSIRLVLPEQVTGAMARHRDAVALQSRRRQGHALIERRRQRGDTLGNPAALAKARKAKKR